MPARDIIVVGASAGGTQALKELVEGLPADLPAAVFVVVHVTSYHRSNLPEILGRSTSLRVAHAVPGEPIERGRVYVAPPDHHLLVRAGHVELSRGPRENRTRPAIDPLFRSAARAYGPRVAAVILSGALGDGVVGLMAVKDRGGAVLVQDPDEAAYSSMPRRAIENIEVDHVLPARRIAEQLARMTAEGPMEGDPGMSEEADEVQALIDGVLEAQVRGERGGEVAVFSCPECGGVVWQAGEGGVLQFRCHVGHTFSPELLLVEKSEALESALWAAVRTLVEKATLTRQLAERMRREGDPVRAGAIEEQVRLDEEHIRILRDTILGAAPNPTAQAYSVGEVLEEAERRRELPGDDPDR